MPLLAIVALAAMTYAFRIAGPLLRDRVTVPSAALVKNRCAAGGTVTRSRSSGPAIRNA